MSGSAQMDCSGDQCRLLSPGERIPRGSNVTVGTPVSYMRSRPMRSSESEAGEVLDPCLFEEVLIAESIRAQQIDSLYSGVSWPKRGHSKDNEDFVRFGRRQTLIKGSDIDRRRRNSNSFENVSVENDRVSLPTRIQTVPGGFNDEDEGFVGFGRRQSYREDIVHDIYSTEDEDAQGKRNDNEKWREKRTEWVWVGGTQV